MQLTNKKLVHRGTRMIVNELEIDAEEAQKLLLKYGSVKNAIENYKTSTYGAISAVKTNNLERT